MNHMNQTSVGPIPPPERLRSPRDLSKKFIVEVEHRSVILTGTPYLGRDIHGIVFVVLLWTREVSPLQGRNPAKWAVQCQRV